MEENKYTGDMEPTDLTPSAEWLPAIVSIDMQVFGTPYEPDNGFNRGTIFPALYKPFLAGGMSNAK